ncbi:hypothetical protein C4577_06915 [Candidatus Parcubacteria bacterium]|nr:MAG: hypothetical protein C4577_06915 [Candidatus Parcubacteria bacterium]
MKKNILSIILILIFILFSNNNSKAVSDTSKKPTTTVKPTISQFESENSEIERIQKIKEMVASKVAELNLVEKKGILGKVSEATNTKIVIENKNKKEKRIIDIDELTKFEESKSNQDFGISDIKSGDELSFVGLYNKDTKRLLARHVARIKSVPAYIEGIVLDKNTGEYTFQVIDSIGNIKTIEVETSTKTQTLEKKNQSLQKSGYSKIETEQRIFIAGFKDLKDSNIIIASRIIQFKDLPPSPEMIKQKDITSIESEIQASTGSGKKLTPIIKK